MYVYDTVSAVTEWCMYVQFAFPVEAILQDQDFSKIFLQDL